MIYLDANATLPLNSSAILAVKDFMDQMPGNPSSVHQGGRSSRAILEKARQTIADYVGCLSSEVVFTSGGTEANNMALKGFKGKPIVISAVEHASIRRAAPEGAHVVCVAKDGVLDLEDLDQKLEGLEKPLVSIMFANNETGVIQPIGQVVERVHALEGLVHCDAVQGLGKIEDLHFSELNLDMMTISAHKVGGPTGIGALIIKDGLPCASLLQGGGQQKGYRSGTENVLGAVGFAAALVEDSASSWQSVKVLRDFMESTLCAVGAKVEGRSTDRLPNTSCLRMPGFSAPSQVMAFDLQGIAVSAGPACSSGKISSSFVLKAMGIEADDAIRVSLSPRTTQEDVDSFVHAWKEIYQSQLLRKKEVS
ncbi:MAG: cysteine desulfurase [bacterium]|nr:cysteine desulfurase [bacterium]